jgi:hypothetical protein
MKDLSGIVLDLYSESAGFGCLQVFILWFPVFVSHGIVQGCKSEIGRDFNSLASCKL